MPSYNPREMESGTLALLSRGLYISESCCAAVSAQFSLGGIDLYQRLIQLFGEVRREAG